MAAIDAERAEPRIERCRIIGRIGMLDGKRRRSAKAGSVPGDDPKSNGQRLQLAPKRCGGRSYAMQ
jgi:hypothetical protein